MRITACCLIPGARKRRWLMCEKARYQLQRREDIEKMKRRRSAFRELWTAKILTTLFGK